MSNPWWSSAQHSGTWGEANPTTSNLGEVALWVTPGAAQRNLGSRNLGPEAPHTGASARRHHEYASVELCVGAQQPPVHLPFCVVHG